MGGDSAVEVLRVRRRLQRSLAWHYRTESDSRCLTDELEQLAARRLRLSRHRCRRMLAATITDRWCICGFMLARATAGRILHRIARGRCSCRGLGRAATVSPRFCLHRTLAAGLGAPRRYRRTAKQLRRHDGEKQNVGEQLMHNLTQGSAIGLIGKSAG